MTAADLKRFLARPGYAIAGGSRPTMNDAIAITIPEAPKKKRAKGPTLPPTVDPMVAAFFAQNGIPPATPEYRFAPPRRWRFDLSWPDRKCALEIEGGAFTNGRHTRGAGFVADLEKYSEAACLGWRLVRVTPDQLLTGKTADMLRRLMP